jgi:hypothetical protein
MPGPTRHRDRGEQAGDAAFAPALRFDQFAARGQRALWFFGQEHAGAGPDFVRAPQGIDLSANRFALPAGGLSGHGHGDVANAGRHALRPRSPTRFSKQQWVRPNKRIFNNAKISDHFAIIPTSLAPKNLSEPEQKLYDMVAKRFLAIFYPAAEFLVTTRITRVRGGAVQDRGQSDAPGRLDECLWPRGARG